MVWRLVSLTNLKCGWKGAGTRSAASSGEEQRGSRGKTRNKPLFTSYHPWAFCSSLLSSLERGLCHRRANPIPFISERERRSFYLFPPSPFSQFGGNKYSPVLLPSPLPGRLLRGGGHSHGRPLRHEGAQRPPAPVPYSRSLALPPALPAPQAAAGGGDGGNGKRGRDARGIPVTARPPPLPSNPRTPSPLGRTKETSAPQHPSRRPPPHRYPERRRRSGLRPLRYLRQFGSAQRSAGPGRRRRTHILLAPLLRRLPPPARSPAARGDAPGAAASPRADALLRAPAGRGGGGFVRRRSRSLGRDELARALRAAAASPPLTPERAQLGRSLPSHRGS